MSATFVNWVGNQRCTPARRLSPSSEAEVQAAVREAAAAGRGRSRRRDRALVLAGAPHRRDADRPREPRRDHPHRRGRRRVRALPGTPVGEFGEPLWQAGLALANQGDIDTQGIAGAIGTATHGSGIRLPSFSATMRRCRLVDGTGEVVEIDGSKPDLLPPRRSAVGMLGVMTEVELEVVPRYRLVQRIEEWTFAGSSSEWDEPSHGHRHFSFFWCPSAGVGRALRPRGDRRRAWRTGVREELRRGAGGRAGGDPAAASTAATASTRSRASSPTSTSSSTSCSSTAAGRPLWRCAS